MKNTGNLKGFSLIELLIVIVIIGILAAISSAALMSSRRTANEGSAISSMRTLHSAQMTYATTYGAGEFAGDIGAGTTTAMAVLRSVSLVDDVLASGTKSGYLIVGGREQSSPTSPAVFFFSAIPSSTNPLTGTGLRRVGVSTDGVLRADQTPTAQYANSAAAQAAPVLNN